MSRFPDDQTHALDLLKYALSALGEDIAKASATKLPEAPAKKLAAIKTLRHQIANAAILAEACDVLLRHPDLLT